ncbi:MAG: YdcF family protein [Proteobacteria bacterium]|nr:YdcF family protein [Pseudomonadota bacterium]
METVLHHTLGLLINPTNVIVSLLCIGFIFMFLKRRALGATFFGLGLGCFILVGMMPLGPWALSFLENRFPVPQTLPQDAAGFIILGGSFDTPLASKRGATSYTRAGGRFYEALRVVSKAPTLPVLFSGGGVSWPGVKSESQTAREILRDLHIPADRFLFEDKSKSTWENASQSFKLIHPQPQDKWILITSAVHMPRAVENFRRAGWHVIPFCVDYLGAPHVAWEPFAIHKNITSWSHAMREIVSLMRDFALGRSKVFIAAP